MQLLLTITGLGTTRILYGPHIARCAGCTIASIAIQIAASTHHKPHCIARISTQTQGRRQRSSAGVKAISRTMTCKAHKSCQGCCSRCTRARWHGFRQKAAGQRAAHLLCTPSCQRAPANRQSAFGLRKAAQPFSRSLKSSPKSAHMQRAEKHALSTRVKTERTPHPNWPASCSEKKQRVDLSLVLAHGACETQPASRALLCRPRQVRIVNHNFS